MLYKVSSQPDFESPSKQPVKLEDQSTELESKDALKEIIEKHEIVEIDEVKPLPNNAETTCDICHKSFNSVTVSIQHRLKVHPQAPTQFSCNDCGALLPLKKYFDEHLVIDTERSVRVIDYMKCDKCETLEPMNESAKKRSITPPSEPEHKCVLCDENLESKEALQEHFRKHANNEIKMPIRKRGFMNKPKRAPNSSTRIVSNSETKCDICDQNFNSIASAIQHRFKMHPTVETKFYCNYCGMLFPLKANWDTHIVTHDTADKFDVTKHQKCETCNVVFYNSDAMIYHNKYAHRSSSTQPEKQMHNCVLCSAILESKEALQEHFRMHANKQVDNVGKANRFKSIKLPKAETKCDICYKNFESVAAAIRHRFKIHPNAQTKYYCNYCGKLFPLKTNWDAHIQTHDSAESRNFDDHKKCKDCGIVFYNVKAWHYHNKSVHTRLSQLYQPVATPPPSNKIKVNSMNDALSVYYCHLCGAEYVVKFNLQQHLEKVHTREEREAMPNDLIKCTMCAAFFYNKKAYDLHNGYHSPDDLYVTSEEQRLQTVTKVDQDFDIRRVKPRLEKYIPKTTPRNYPRKVQEPKPNEVVETIPKFEEVMIVEPKKMEKEPYAWDSYHEDSSDSESDVPLSKRLKLS